MNSRHNKSINFSAFKVLTVATYVVNLMNLFINIKMELFVFFVYGSFADGKLIMKFIVIIVNGFSSSKEIDFKKS